MAGDEISTEAIVVLDPAAYASPQPRCQYVLDGLPEWTAYAKNPGPLTLRPLVAATRRLKRYQEVIPSLIALLNATDHWKVAQHLSLLCREQESLAYADYFAQRAVKLSDGDPFARATLARVLWDRRLIVGVLDQTIAMRLLARRLRDRKRRALLQAEIAELNALAYSYSADLGQASRWIQALMIRGSASIECWMQIMFAARHANHLAYWEAVSMTLAAHIQKLGPRPAATVRHGLRIGLLRVLAARLGRGEHDEV